MAVAAERNISVQDGNHREVGSNSNINTKFFCGNSKWKGHTDISCDERVSYLTNRYGLTRFEARESLLEESCTCSSSSLTATRNNYVNITKMITIRDPDETFQSSLELAPWDAPRPWGGVN